LGYNHIDENILTKFPGGEVMKIGNKTLMILSVLAIIIIVMFGSFLGGTRKERRVIEAVDSKDISGRLVVGRANDSVTLDPSCTTEMDSFKVTVTYWKHW